MTSRVKVFFYENLTEDKSRIVFLCNMRVLVVCICCRATGVFCVHLGTYLFQSKSTLCQMHWKVLENQLKTQIIWRIKNFQNKITTLNNQHWKRKTAICCLLAICCKIGYLLQNIPILCWDVIVTEGWFYACSSQC